MKEFQKGEMTNSNGWTLEWGSAYIQVRDENGDFVRFDRMSEREIEALDKMEERLARYPWRSDPPTEKQLSALEYYGYKGPKPRTKGAASDLIKKYKE